MRNRKIKTRKFGKKYILNQKENYKCCIFVFPRKPEIFIFTFLGTWAARPSEPRQQQDLQPSTALHVSGMWRHAISAADL
jgi:hypothetical protein